MEQNNNTLNENLKRKAYMLGLKLKNSGLDEEIIYARLEKQGIPIDLAKIVASDIMKEQKKEVIKDTKASYNVSLVLIGIGVLVAIISSFILPGKIIIPVGIIIGGIISAVLYKRKMKD
jgi:hypothetical protein